MTEIQHRPVRSFVLRQGRMSKGQTRAYETLMPKFGVPYSVEKLDMTQLFGRTAPRILEIGFGMGDSTAKIAQSHPENDYLCLEVHTPGVGSLLKYIEELGLTNIRIVQHDAVEVLQHMLGPETLDGVHIFFPDPWHKKRHHKRRLIQPAFTTLICDRLKSGGYLHAATDWEEYAAHILETFQEESRLVNSVNDYAPRPGYRPMTKFEQRGIRLGHGVWDIVFRKV